MNKIAAAVVALALLGDPGATQFVWQWPDGRGGLLGVTIVGGWETARVGKLNALFFDTPADRRCYILTATFGDGSVVEHADRSECGAALPLVQGP